METSIVTNDLSQFGFREIRLASELLAVYSENSWKCPYFSNDGVTLNFNTNSGNVFLSDSDYNVLMMNGNDCEGFYVSPYSGYEGFFDDLLNDFDDSWHDDDKKWFKQLANDLNKSDELQKILDGIEENEDED